MMRPRLMIALRRFAEALDDPIDPTATTNAWGEGIESAHEGRKESGESGLPDLRGKRVVVIEDEGLTQLQIRKALNRAGMILVGAANNGQQGIELVLKEQPDLVLMDIRMPIMDGLEAARRILHTHQVCIVFVTAFAESIYQEEARQMGAGGYILKPITADSLMPQMQAAYHQYQVTK